MAHAEIIASLDRALEGQSGISALFLSGSHGTGHADAWSDVDFVMVAEEGPTDRIATIWRKAVEEIGEIVLWWDRNTRPALINAVTADWTRIDLIILKPDQLGMQRQDALKVLFDHGGHYEALAPVTEVAAPSPARLRYQIEEFIRILGLLPLSVGREEYLNGVLGVFHLRNLLVDLMIVETGARHRGGMLHLNRLITQDQKDVLNDLPPPVPERDAMIAAHLAYAAAFLPRARRMAAARDVDWPERFEEVTWQNLDRALGLSRPYTQ